MSADSIKKFSWLPWLFGVSLLINACLLGGYIYHRYLLLPPPERWQGVQKSLNLSDAQSRELIDLQDELRDEARQSMLAMRDSRRELVQLLRKDSLDLGELESRLRATTEPQISMQRDVILRMLAFRRQLTPEQQASFNEKIEHPGFLLRLAGFPGPMWRSHHCRRNGERHGDEARGERQLSSPPDSFQSGMPQ